MVSIIILTKNDEADLPGCLESVRWCDDVHLLDSVSTDATAEIAQDFGAKISSYPFKSSGDQRNYAIGHIETKHPWILFLEANEQSTEEFRDAVHRTIAAAGSDVAGFHCCWKLMLEGKWLRHCDRFPHWQFRLVRKGMARFIDLGTAQKESLLSGRAEYLREPFLQVAFSRGWSHWLERHNKKSTLEAAERQRKWSPIEDLFSSDASVRQPALKSWASRIPGWPLLRFVQAYFLSLGFLEGRPAFHYCVNLAYYEFLIQIKMRELKVREKQLQEKRRGNV